MDSLNRGMLPLVKWSENAYFTRILALDITYEALQISCP
jgi:hypothetical protein